MRKGPRNPFRILASVVERGTAAASGNDSKAPARKSDIRLRDEKGLDVGVQQSSRRARSNRRRCGAPVISSFLLRSVPMIYWTYRNHSKTCVQEYGFGIRFDGGNVFPNLEGCVRECCPPSCRPQCCAHIEASCDDL
ncbi:hypothetical protein Tcan_08677 [Toxocara canis]|uniref:Uncharacterized protein n=1 Tax=Toxocara canis TaxID=6265 RepID=A0A0B2VX38_TOXCA|nr:hypothetical protein Tcan_08677 [Toxocara canis]